MKRPGMPANETARLHALESYGVLDTPAESCFDDLTAIAAYIAKVPIALVSLVDDDRQWFKSRYGLDAPQAPRDVSFCGHVVTSGELIVVPDAARDERFFDNPLVTGEPWVGFYVGVPLKTSDGLVLGTLCAIDHRPRQIEDVALVMIERLARQVMDQLELRRKGLIAARYQAIVESSDDAIIAKDLAGVVVSWNGGAERTFGYSPNEMIGGPIMRIVPEDRWDEERYIVSRIISGAPIQQFETVRQTKRGDLIDVSVTVSPIRDAAGVIVGASKVARDITAHRRQSAALARSEARLQAIVRTAADPILTLDEQGIVETANEAAERMFGFSMAELVGRNVKTLSTSPGPAGRDGHPAAEARNGQTKAGLGREVEAKRRDGTTFPVELSVGEMIIDGQRRYTAILRDISERKRSESRLAGSLREKEALLQEVHHRVKNNLQLVASLINIQIRKLGGGNSDVQPLLDCKGRVETIALIHEQLYQVNDYGKIPFRGYVSTLVNRIMSATTTQASIALDLAIDDITLGVEQALPCGILLNELVTNAVKHGFPGGRRGTISIRIAALAEGDIELCVSDDGVGLPPGFALGRSQSLGLQVVATLVAQLDGRVDVSAGTGGASFRVVFKSKGDIRA